MLHLKNQFLKIYSSYFGEKMSSPEQLKEVRMSGPELKQFCEFYLQHFRTSDEIRYSKDDRKVSRILWFTIGLITAMFLSLLASHFNLYEY